MSKEFKRTERVWLGRPLTFLAVSTLLLLVVTAKPVEAARKPDCSNSLQALINSAAPSSVVEAPGRCIYRERVAITKPITLKGATGAEIRGSEVWKGWRKRNQYWVKGKVPSFSPGKVRCESNTSRCRWPAQVFFDGKPLRQVDAKPRSGQFAVNDNRSVILADNPSGHVVEVTVRRQWVVGKVDNVTIQGFTMKHAANAREFGAITNRHDSDVYYHSNWTIKNNVLSDAHTAVVVLKGTGNKLLSNNISRGGQLGVHGSGTDILIQGNRIHHNNTERFNPFWEAGGVKMAYKVKNLRVVGNTVFRNRGAGVWCDIDCTNVVYQDNRVHHNSRSGLFFEISSGAKIFGNVVWENGWGRSAGPWSPGISVEGSRNVEVYNNTLAWNAAGISIIHMPRSEPRWNIVENVNVHDNVILANKEATLSWIQDRNWAEGMMGNPSANNRGVDNRYWYPSTDNPMPRRYRWVTRNIGNLRAFNKTLGEQDGRYIGLKRKKTIVSQTSIPSSPEKH